MPKVSVIIPTYNRGSFIRETIESVLEQTFSDFEIIVIDDGSTDDTSKVLQSFGSKITILNQKRSERAISRNNGVKNSRGKYLAFLDSDDIWERNKLEKQVEILDSKDDIVLVYSKSLRINDKSEKIKPAKRQLEGFSGEVFEKLLMRNFVVSATPLLRRESFEKTSGFSSEHIPYEDWGCWIKLSLLGKFYFLPLPLVKYRIHKNQSVKNIDAKKIETVTLSVLEDSFKLKPITDKIKNKALGLAYLRFTYWYLCSGDTKQALKKLSCAFSLYPQFALDPKWHGLNFLCNFPALRGKSIFKLEQYH